MNSLTLSQSAALSKGKSNSIFDILKFVLCVMIVAIHTNFMPRILNPWLKLAVPLFFIMSSYFLWRKLAACQSAKEQSAVLRNFIKRNVILYGFWTLFWSPVILLHRQYFSNGVAFGFLRIVRSCLFSSTYIASWFLAALVVSCVCVFYLSRFMSDKLLFIASSILHVLIVLAYTYYSDSSSTPPLPSTHLYLPTLETFKRYYELIFTNPVNSFPVAFFWVVCGKCFANPSSRIHIKNMSLRIKLALTALFLGFLYAEWRYVVSISGEYSKTPYIMLAPACVFLFNSLLSAPPAYFEKSRLLRKISVLIYVTHGSVNFIVRRMGQYAFHMTVSESVAFFATLLICLSMCACVLSLEKTDRFAWLRYVR